MKNRESDEPLHPDQPMTEEQLSIMMETISDIPAAIASLPIEEQQKYHDAQQSIVDARRAGEELLYTDDTVYGR